MNYEYMAMKGCYDPSEVSDPYEEGFLAGLKEASEAAAGFAYEFDDDESSAMHERVEASLKREAVLEAARALRANYFESLIHILDAQMSKGIPEAGPELSDEQAQKRAFVRDRLAPMLKVATEFDVADVEYAVVGGEEFVHVTFASGFRKRACVTGDSLKAIVEDVLKEL